MLSLPFDLERIAAGEARGVNPWKAITGGEKKKTATPGRRRGAAVSFYDWPREEERAFRKGRDQPREEERASRYARNRSREEERTFRNLLDPCGSGS